jgi:hypothetical protein
VLNLRISLLESLLCGSVMVLLLAALLLAVGSASPDSAELMTLLLASSTIPLAGAVWATTFRR